MEEEVINLHLVTINIKVPAKVYVPLGNGKVKIMSKQEYVIYKNNMNKFEKLRKIGIK